MTRWALRLRRDSVSVLGATAFLLAMSAWNATSVGQTPADGDEQAIAQANNLSRAFRSAAKSVIPTVVVVRTTIQSGKLNGTGRANPFGGTPFEDLFKDSPNGRHPDVPLPGMGSGVIIGDGLVLTNNHVIEGADEVTIEVLDGRQLEVTDIKTDPKTDLAVLRYESDEPLPIAKLGDSDSLDIGDWVIAVGTPFELEHTVSAGIISAKGRTLSSVERARFLQTDAAINPGNSGGPLVNLSGEVVGINTAIFSRTGAYQGIGFAIPINLAKWVTPQLTENGSVRRAYMGVGIGDIPAARSKELGVAPNQGVMVLGVYEDSPAARSGLKQDDIITSFDRQPITSSADLQEIVERSSFGSEHVIKIVRDGKPQELQVIVEAMPEKITRALRGKPNSYNAEELGLIVMDVSEYMSKQLGLQGKQGALIMNVDRGRPAGRAGLTDGMLIQKINGKPVSGVADFVEALEGASLKDGISVEVLSDTGSRSVELKLN